MAAPTAPKAGINRKFSAIFAAAEMKCMRAEARCCWVIPKSSPTGPNTAFVNCVRHRMTKIG